GGRGPGLGGAREGEERLARVVILEGVGGARLAAVRREPPVDVDARPERAREAPGAIARRMAELAEREQEERDLGDRGGLRLVGAPEPEAARLALLERAGEEIDRAARLLEAPGARERPRAVGEARRV